MKINFETDILSSGLLRPHMPALTFIVFQYDDNLRLSVMAEYDNIPLISGAVLILIFVRATYHSILNVAKNHS
jgi:hypothetical protein